MMSICGVMIGVYLGILSVGMCLISKIIIDHKIDSVEEKERDTWHKKRYGT